MAYSTQLAPLLYRADWTTWSFSADIVVRRNPGADAELRSQLTAQARRDSGGLLPPFPLGRVPRSQPADPPAAPEWVEHQCRLLVAPGGRYRFEPAAASEGDGEAVTLIVCDGESCWEVRGSEADRFIADPACTPMDAFIRPGRLLTEFRLTASGMTEYAGRTAYLVTGSPRLAASELGSELDPGLEADLRVDAELGLVLRKELTWAGSPLTITELRILAAGPEVAADPALFRPDPGIEADVMPTPWHRDTSGAGSYGDDYAGQSSAEGGVGSLAVLLGSAAVGLTARRLARPEPRRGAEPDDEAVLPESAAWPASRADQAGPIADDLVNLIAGTGLQPPDLRTEVHRWTDPAIAAHAIGAFSGAGPHDRWLGLGFAFFGSSGLWPDSRGGHRCALLRVATADRYRIDYQRDDRPRQPLAVACDGDRLRKVFHNRVIASPAQRLPAVFGRLLDPAWLLSDWVLTAAGRDVAGGRSALRVVAEPPPRAPGWPRPAESRRSGWTSSSTASSASCCARCPTWTARLPSASNCAT